MSKKQESPAILEASEIASTEQNTHRSRVTLRSAATRSSPSDANSRPENSQRQAMIPPKLSPPPSSQTAASFSQPASNSAANSKRTPEPVSGQGETASLDAESELAEKKRLVQLCLEAQNTLDALMERVERVREENAQLRSENLLLASYCSRLISNSDLFTSAAPTASSSAAARTSASGSRPAF